MARKTLTLGTVFILALSLLVASMITCFTYDAEAHDKFLCRLDDVEVIVNAPLNPPWDCVPFDHVHEHVTE